MDAGQGIQATAPSEGDGEHPWGHSDMAGSLWEWTLDSHVRDAGYEDRFSSEETGERLLRSGSYKVNAEDITTFHRHFYTETPEDTYHGVRCARDP